MCTIAGSDPTGGAGLQGDLRTFAAHGGHGGAVVTAVTVQDERGVHGIHAVPPTVVAAQLEAALETSHPAAAKTGMLLAAATVDAIGDVFDARGAPPLVVDPVLGASGGGLLLATDGLPRLAARLAGHAVLLTPNLPEAAALLGRARIEHGTEEEAARSLLAQGWAAVLLKGGHGEGAEAVDWLVTPTASRRLALPRLGTAPVHGTGCALAAATAARLGRGEGLERAVLGAKDYVHRLIRRAHEDGTWLLPHLAVLPAA